MRKPSILVFDHQDQYRTVKARTVRIVSGPARPKCAWCKLRQTRALCSYFVKGTKTEIHTVVCYCDDCHLATIVEFEKGLLEGLEV